MAAVKKLVGTREFYKEVLTVAVPIMIQNGITNFVGLLDNIMVGRIGTEQMSGIAIVNQLLLVFNLAIFGAISGAGIFGAQYYGCRDNKGVQHTFRYKLYICLLLVTVGILLFLSAGENLIMLYLHGEGNDAALTSTLKYGKEYLLVMLFGLLPFGLESAYSGTLRECGETMVPMKAGVVAVFVNLVLNYLLIFGKFGCPELGVTGAAIATVISRYVQVAIVIAWTHTHGNRMAFIEGVYKEWKIPSNLVAKITIKGTPLMINEILWAAGMATLMQCYSIRGLEVVAGLNISSTITNLFNVVFMSMGNAVAIIVGQLLGAGKTEEAKETDAQLIAFSVASCVVLGAILIVLAPLFPKMYNTSAEAKRLATEFIRVGAGCMPLYAFLHAAYFTLRSGGKTIITFLFDSVYLWCLSIPLAFVLSRFTGMNIVPLYLCCQLIDIVKCIIGFVLVKKGVWINNIVED